MKGSSPTEISPNWTGSFAEPTPIGSGRLHIAIVISLFSPFESGAERQARLQAERLAHLGHRVTVFTRFFQDLPVHQTISGFSSGGKIEIRRVIRTSKRGPLFGLSYVLSLLRELFNYRHRISVVHSHQALWESITLGIARVFLPCPVIIQPASSGYDGEAQELMRTKGHGLLRRLALRNRLFASISDDIQKEWETLGVPKKHFFSSLSGVDTKQFAPSETRSLFSDPDSVQAIFTGRLHAQKQVDLLIRAWPRVRKSVKGRLVILGDGPLRDELTRLRDSLGMTSAEIDFRGRVDDPSEDLRNSDLFLLPSRAEGMSNSLLEAMSSGLACVVSAIGGNVDLIDHQVSGFRATESTVESWATTIIDATRNPELARRCGQVARERILREHSIEAVVDRNLMIYRRAMQGSRKTNHL
ncbi:MAG: D-inositol 3-phosphate glycosyltransferase [Planctomycetota bacterium]